MTWKKLKMGRADVQKWTSCGGNWITKWESDADLLHIGIMGKPEQVHCTVEEAKAYIAREIVTRNYAI